MDLDAFIIGYLNRGVTLTFDPTNIQLPTDRHLVIQTTSETDNMNILVN